MTQPILSGWWSWLVATFAGLMAFVAVASIADEADVVGGLVMGALTVVVVGALAVRHRAPRVAAWMLLIGVGMPGVGFFWFFLIPTAMALMILIGGVRTGEISFIRKSPTNATTG